MYVTYKMYLFDVLFDWTTFPHLSGMKHMISHKNDTMHFCAVCAMKKTPNNIMPNSIVYVMTYTTIYAFWSDMFVSRIIDTMHFCAYLYIKSIPHIILAFDICM